MKNFIRCLWLGLAKMVASAQETGDTTLLLWLQDLDLKLGTIQCRFSS